ncbi:MAG: tetratricopeptide repeat protein [Chloroflexi bacterium]|nr:tetratricopeptide repeat protein [Chloroflexota bacterium]
MSNLPANPNHARAIEAYRAARYDEALRLLNTARAEAQASGDSAAEARALNDLGVVNQHMGKRDEARVQFEAAIALFAQAGNEHARAQALGNTGTLLGEMRNPRDAAARLEQAQEIFTRLGDKQNAALTLKWLSRMYMQNWNFVEAIFAYERALARLEPLPPGQALLRRFLQIPIRILQR